MVDLGLPLDNISFNPIQHGGIWRRHPLGGGGVESTSLL